LALARKFWHLFSLRPTFEKFRLFWKVFLSLEFFVSSRRFWFLALITHKMEELRGFKLADLCEKINSKDDTFVRWLQHLKLLHKTRTCECGKKVRPRNIRAGETCSHFLSFMVKNFFLLSCWIMFLLNKVWSYLNLKNLKRWGINWISTQVLYRIVYLNNFIFKINFICWKSFRYSTQNYTIFTQRYLPIAINCLHDIWAWK
jgi:hypothetical protein